MIRTEVLTTNRFVVRTLVLINLKIQTIYKVSIVQIDNIPRIWYN